MTFTIMGAALLILAIVPVRAVAQTGPLDSRDRALLDAADGGDVAAIEELLNTGAHVNSVLIRTGSPLIAASRKGRLDAVRLLLDRGADPNLAVPGDGNPLIMAARAGYTDVVALLLDRGAKIDLIGPDDENALIQASAAGRLEVVKLLVARGANVNVSVWVESEFDSPDGEWRTPLNMARRGGHDAVVAFLASAGARD